MNRDPAIIIVSNTNTLPSTIGSMLIDPPEPEVLLVLLLVVTMRHYDGRDLLPPSQSTKGIHYCKVWFLIIVGSARRSLDHVPGLRLGSGLRVAGHVVGAIDPSIDPG